MFKDLFLHCLVQHAKFWRAGPGVRQDWKAEGEQSKSSKMMWRNEEAGGW